MKDRLIPVTLLVLAMIVIAAGFLCAFLASAHPDVSITSISRLTPGMTEAQVATKLGLPTADLTARPPVDAPAPVPGGKLLEYAGTSATVLVEFGPDGRMRHCHPTAIRTVSGIERLRLRLNWW
jgi:hypothetical protein